MVQRRTIGVKLNEEQIAALNLKLRQSGYTSIAEMVRDFINGSYSPSNYYLDKLSTAVSEKVVQRLYIDPKGLAEMVEITSENGRRCQHRHLTRAHAPH
ncbi:MAG: hypothetical protein JRN67_13160 [Nitrososphaerota archaeon]|nr:hypothetical protein [Nitrososphaerota archaeon]